MKRTAFYDIHRELGAKLVDFAGFEMPVQYSGIIEEHTTVRTAVGLFDVSHMGEFEISGPDALALVQRVTTNDAAKLSAGKAQYSAMCYEDGGIVDDLLVYCRGEKYMLVVNASNIEKDFAWIESHAGGLKARLTNRSDEFSLLAVQGPRSLDTLQTLTNADLAAIAYYSFVEGEVAGVPCIISRTGYTGELGFELYFDSARSSGEKVWRAIMESGSAFGIRPIGLGARDTLRLEMGFCLYGNDIDKSTNPLEAGLGWITKLEKGDFIGKNTLALVKQRGLKRKLVGFVVDAAKALPRHGYEIYGGAISAGIVTSGTISPVLEKGIGMGYVETSLSQPATPIQILVRSNHVGAHVVKLPFIVK